MSPQADRSCPQCPNCTDLRPPDRLERSVKNMSLCDFIATPQDFLQRLKVFHAALNAIACTYVCTIWTLRTRDLLLP